MIAIHKGAGPPGLVRAGEEHARQLCEAYDADPGPYNDGTRKMAVRDTIYASDAVKAALEACHHGKCCYCETYIPRPFAYSHVEHWRPKGGFLQRRGEVRNRPGYYWLAYDWDNLLLSCAPCNLNKSDLFPIENPTSRARHHGMRIEDETPGILKPDGNQDPREHVTFHRELPVGRTELGIKTIEVLRLDTEMYDEPRRTHLMDIEKKIEWSINMMGNGDSVVQKYAQILRASVEGAVQPDRPYSAMVAAYLAVNPLPPLPTARS